MPNTEAELKRVTEERDHYKAMVDWLQSPAKSCLEGRSDGRGGCGACSVCCKELREAMLTLRTACELALAFARPTKDDAPRKLERARIERSDDLVFHLRQALHNTKDFLF